MKKAIAVSKTTGAKFNFEYEVFSTGRKSMHSCKIEVGGAWRSATVFAHNDCVSGIAEFMMPNGKKGECKFILEQNDDTKAMIEYYVLDQKQVSERKEAKRQAYINQETFLD